MILIVTNQADYTVDFLILGLKERGVDFLRFNTEDFPLGVDLKIEIKNGKVEGAIKTARKCVAVSEIRSVWYRRPKSSKVDPALKDEAVQNFVVTESRTVLEGLWNILPCRWISHPNNIRVAESKIFQLVKAAEIGFLVPTTLVTNEPNSAKRFYYEELQRIIYKPLRYSRILRNDKMSLVYTNLIKPEHVDSFDSIKYAPSLFQNYIEKDLEIRVVVVGNHVFAIELHSQLISEAQYDWRRVDAVKIQHLVHQLPPEVETKCINLVTAFGLSFSAIGLILTPNGDYVFLELNPNGQWAWIQQLLPEVDIRRAIIDELLLG